jgi:putative oxidoreductase
MKRGAFAIRLFLGGIFLYSGLIKASSSAQFAIALAPFTLISESWLVPLSLLLPFAEFAAGLLIVIPSTKRFGAFLILGLCLVFIAALSWAMANGIAVSCPCFGDEEEPSLAKMTLSLLRDIVIAALAFVILLEDRLHALGRRKVLAQNSVS